MEAGSVAEIPKATPGQAALAWVRRNILWIILIGGFALLFVLDPTRAGINLKNGVSNGAIWALIALGYTLVYGIIELINFAHGEVFMLGSFVTISLWSALGVVVGTSPALIALGIFVAMIASMLVCGSLNLMIERVAYKPLRNAGKLAPLITAIGMSFILQNVGLLWKGGAAEGVPDLLDAQKSLFTIFGVSIDRGDVFAVAVTLPLLYGLVQFVSHTRYGKAMRATAQDMEASRLMGINVDRTITLTFVLGGLMAGAAGLIYALYIGTVQFNQGFTAGLIAFTAAVMGGIGNLKGAVLGGFIIGIIQQTSDDRIAPVWTPVVVFAILILVMVFRPEGLLGEETRAG